MDNALIGFIIIFGTFHLLLVVIPIINTLRASISATSKILWCIFLVLLPFIGVAFFHFRFRSSLFQGKAYERSTAEERASSGTLAPHDND